MRGVMAQCYHESCDNVDNLITEENLRFLAKTADTLVGTIKHNGGWRTFCIFNAI